MRRNRGTLAIVGAGVTFFGFWSVIKLVMECLIGNVSEETITAFADTGWIMDIIVTFIMVHIVLSDVIFRYIVGRCAWREARGLRQGHWYLIFTVFISLGSVISILIQANSIINRDDFSLYDYAYLIVELTSLIILIETVVASICCKRRSRANAA